MSKENIRDSISFLINLFLNIDIYGQENVNILSRDKSVLIPFFPHTTHFDSLVARLSIPKQFRSKLMFAAASDYWFEDGLIPNIKTFFATLFLPSFPMNREGAGFSEISESLIAAEGFLKLGYSLALSPEGTRSSLPFEKRRLKPGIAQLVLKTGSPIVPMLFSGLENLMPKGSTFPNISDVISRRKIEVKIGEAMYFEKRPDLFIEEDDVQKRMKQRIERAGERRKILGTLKSTYLEMQND